PKIEKPLAEIVPVAVVTNAVPTVLPETAIAPADPAAMVPEVELMVAEVWVPPLTVIPPAEFDSLKVQAFTWILVVPPPALVEFPRTCTDVDVDPETEIVPVPKQLIVDKVAT